MQTNPVRKISQRLYQISLLLLLALSWTGCQNIYDETLLLEQGAWTTDQKLEFEFDIDNTDQLYNLFLEVEHQTGFAYQNLYCWVQSYDPAGQLVQEQMASLELANKKGYWLGDCSAETCTRKIPFLVKTKFEATGRYKIVLQQYARVATVDAINSVRLFITQAKNS